MMMQVLTNRLIQLATTELRKPETTTKIRTAIVAPLVSMIYAHVQPYVIIGVIVLVSLLISTNVLLIVLAMVYFHRHFSIVSRC
jgi:hypothetical protein